MSGFDFGALRDPDAPLPGAGERARVDQRASQIRARARRNRFAATATSIVAVAVVIAGVIATTRDNGPTVTVRGGTTSSAPTSTTTAGYAAGDRFVPPTTTQNGLVVMPVTFPDGETTTLRYPPAMKIAQLGFAGGIGVSGKQVLISYCPTYPACYHANGSELAFRFGPWLARVSANGMTAAEGETWAHSLSGSFDANGYLLLHAAAPLALNNQFDGGFGAFVAGDNEVELSSHLHCGQPPSDTTTHRHFVNGDGTQGVAWCVDSGLHVAASGSPTFVHLADKLAVATLAAPGTITNSTTTTTTTTVPAGPPSAVSASFVSATHGWVLQRNGDVAETTDGGHSWNRVGSVGSTSEGKIRFADATHGFAFSGSESNPASSMATADGGRTWAPLQAPFTGTVYDLAISRGTVYAVTFDSTPEFRIWSSPADHLTWTEDFKIPVGAGPVPSIQLVLAGNTGWLIEVDRVVVAGARLSPTTGHWSAWTPPCKNVNGPATLAAWGPTDLIASCDEGVWGSPPGPGTAVYTSHDAGATFQRYAAPVFGAVAADDPNNAVIIASQKASAQSTDGGRSWQTAAGLIDDPSGASDLGFTTDSQGFVIFGDGQMLMTYDAGATWSAVTRP